MEFVTAAREHSFFGAAVQRIFVGIRNIVNDSSGANYVAGLADQSTASNILYNFGHEFMIGLGLLGILISLNSRNHNYLISSFVVLTGLLFFLMYPLTLLGFSEVLLPHRSLVFLEIPLIMFSSISIVVTLQSKSKMKQLLVLLIVSTLIISTISTPYLNRGDELYGEGIDSRIEFYESEQSSFDWSFTHRHDMIIYKDPIVATRSLRIEAYRSKMPIDNKPYNSYPTSEIYTYPIDMDYSNDSLIIYREYLDNNQLSVGMSFRERVTNINGSKYKEPLLTENKVHNSGNSSVYINNYN